MNRYTIYLIFQIAYIACIFFYETERYNYIYAIVSMLSSLALFYFLINGDPTMNFILVGEMIFSCVFRNLVQK